MNDDCCEICVHTEIRDGSQSLWCNLHGKPVTDDDTAVVDVINPSILIEKTPDLQYALVNGTATFTIKVTNTGNVPLANVSVTDALAPSCNRAAGTIPLLLPSPGTPNSFTYTCTVAVTAGENIDTATVANAPSGSPASTATGASSQAARGAPRGVPSCARSSRPTGPGR